MIYPVLFKPDGEFEGIYIYIYLFFLYKRRAHKYSDKTSRQITVTPRLLSQHKVRMKWSQKISTEKNGQQVGQVGKSGPIWQPCTPYQSRHHVTQYIIYILCTQYILIFNIGSGLTVLCYRDLRG